jgi:hypothetical protein
LNVFKGNGLEGTRSSGDRNNNGASDVTITKGLYPDWRDNVEELTIAPDGTTEKVTRNRKVLTAYEYVSERFEQALVLPSDVGEGVWRASVVYVGTRLLTTSAIFFTTLAGFETLGVILWLLWLTPTLVLVWRLVQDVRLLQVCWWVVLAIVLGVIA